MGSLTLYLAGTLIIILVLELTFPVSSVLETDFAQFFHLQKSQTTKIVFSVMLVGIGVYFVYAYFNSPQGRSRPKYYAKLIKPQDYATQTTDYTRQKLAELYTNPEFQHFMKAKADYQPRVEPVYQLSDDEISD